MATLRTMQFQRTYYDWLAFETRCVALGDTHCYDEASGTGSTGRGSIALPASTSRPAGSCILIPRNASLRHEPQAGAVCGNSARTDLCGGRSAMAVPTATIGLLTGHKSRELRRYQHLREELKRQTVDLIGGGYWRKLRRAERPLLVHAYFTRPKRNQIRRS